MALTVTDAVLDGVPVNVRAEGGVIAAIGAGVVAEPGDEVVDARGFALVGGLINGHGHAAMTLFRGYGSDLQLQEWLEHMIWPAEARLTDDDVYWGTRLAALEMIRSGTTHFYDMYWHPGAAARAAEDAGIRATVGAPLFDGQNPAGLSALRDTALASLDELDGCGPLITPSLTPHALYTVSAESLDFVGALAAERGLIVHIHLSETRREVDEWMADHRQRPAVFADERGLIGPRTILAHGSHLNRDELELVARRGATVVTNPVSNLKLASGDVFPYPLAKSCGVAVGMGTDGASSNNSLDLLSDVKVFALIQKHAAYDATAVPATEALEIAQGRRSPLLDGRAFAVGAPADFLLIDTDLPHMTPGALVDNLVYSAAVEVVAEARRCAARVING
jgi:5-methylthioadenosine/S-adenosylhomocysteine deaminase